MALDHRQNPPLRIEDRIDQPLRNSTPASGMPTPSLLIHSRQKSCIQCARAKRRCHPQTPRCSRCISRGLKCAYKNEPLIDQTRSWPAATSSSSSTTEITGPGSQYEIYDVSGVVDDVSSLPAPVEFSFSDYDVNQWLCLDTSPPAPFAPLPLYPYPETAKIDKWSTNQILLNMKRFPAMFACSQKTPFIHARLYETSLPEPIQDAFAVSAAYASRNADTEDMVLRILESKATNLAQKDNSTWSIQEQLAGVQALLLFHIIQLFDGDIRQRSVAESHDHILEAWTMRLHSLSTNEDQSKDWRSWISTESVHRTVILSIFVLDIYSVLKRGYCTNVPKLAMLPFTLNAELWNATSAAAWSADAELAGAKTVMYGEYSQAWESGQIVRKTERFQKLLLIPCLGERYKDALELEESKCT